LASLFPASLLLSSFCFLCFFCLLIELVLFFLYSYRPPPDLHSFPTRRSSDLLREHIERYYEPLTTGTGQLLKTVSAYVEFGSSLDRKSTRLNSSHVSISYAVFCLKKKK